MEDFPKHLTAWMSRMCYNAPQAASELDVTAQTVRNWIRGRKNPHWKAFEALMEKLSDVG